MGFKNGDQQQQREVVSTEKQFFVAVNLVH